MKTRNSIDMDNMKDKHKCFAFRNIAGIITCEALRYIVPECGTPQCPFYKPVGCDDWIRIDDEDGHNLIPPEDYYEDYYSRRRFK